LKNFLLHDGKNLQLQINYGSRKDSAEVSSGIVIYYLYKKTMKDDTDIKNQEYAEPPELRAAGVPPLRKMLNWVTITVAILLLIVLAFAVYFYLRAN
jgi:hypothetical protein